jgi:hypothetical protein
VRPRQLDAEPVVEGHQPLLHRLVEHELGHLGIPAEHAALV